MTRCCARDTSSRRATKATPPAVLLASAMNSPTSACWGCPYCVNVALVRHAALEARRVRVERGFERDGALHGEGGGIAVVHGGRGIRPMPT